MIYKGRWDLDIYMTLRLAKYQFNFKAGVYVWGVLVALYIFLYVLTYY